MKIVVINGDMRDSDSDFSLKVSSLSSFLRNEHEVQDFQLNQMDIRQCIGCWSCWVKTPGECILKDDMKAVYHSIMSSDLILFASPIVAGFTSSLLKTMQERMIPLLHPYMEIRKGEIHHRKRYPSYPNMALLMEKEMDTTDEDVTIISDIYDRLALNFHSENKKIWFLNTQTREEIKHDIDNF